MSGGVAEVIQSPRADRCFLNANDAPPVVDPIIGAPYRVRLFRLNASLNYWHRGGRLDDYQILNFTFFDCHAKFKTCPLVCET